jgi:Zn-dependent M28 family amino/carboxypeptidase
MVRLKAIILLAFLVLLSGCREESTNRPGFDGNRAFNNVEYQLSLGPRTIGSAAHERVQAWAMEQLTSAGWNVEKQTLNWSGIQVNNIIATRGEGNPWIILGAHYDSRLYADQDPNPGKRTDAVPGANDGASGVAVLIELAYSMPIDIEKNVWIVLFDAEDNGNIYGWDWIYGSRAFVGQLEGKPDAVVVIDMIGDADLNIYWEMNSDAGLLSEIWTLANELGYEQFIPEYRYRILDDHIPFVQAGIPAVDIIDFDYPYWHTTQDTLDKVSVESLDAIGEVLLAWLVR